MEERKVRYLCPCCFEDSGIDLIKYPEVKFNNGEHYISHYDGLETIIEPWVTFKAICYNCGYPVEFIDIDEGFVDIIQYLNKGPYTTMFCCEGHEIIDENNYDHPYLIFTCNWDDKTYAKMIRHLPESWEIFKFPVIDTDEYHNKYFTTQSEIRLYCRNFYKYPNCMDALKDYIYKWFPYPKEK